MWYVDTLRDLFEIATCPHIHLSLAAYTVIRFERSENSSRKITRSNVGPAVHVIIKRSK